MSTENVNPEEISYVAFISYRHKDLDRNTGVKVQRCIERYTVPKDLRDMAGGKKLGKVFRDEDELPLSSSLSDSITYALDHSKFLIVICTPDLPLSKWCEQEIRYFLSTHDRDHIITVLADGTPDESFSPLLLKKFDEEGNVIGDTEPLAANIAAETDRQRWKLFAKEKYRILAALIGCAFDELYKREQRYKRRRNFALGSMAAAIVLSFMGVLINRNAEIKRNYEQALRNQSMYLAAESDALLSEGDRLSSIALAIEALPSEKSDRPHVSKAEYALAKSVYAYSNDWNRSWKSTYVVNSALKHSNDILSFIVSDDHDKVISMTRDSVINAWDTKKNVMLWSMQIEDHNYAGLVGFLDDGTVIVHSSGVIYFLNGQSGSVKYEKHLSEEGRFVAVSAAMLSENGKRIAVSCNYGIYVFDTETGAIICYIECPEDSTLDVLDISSEGDKIAAGYSQRSFSYLYSGIKVFDADSGEIIYDFDSFSVDEMYFVDALICDGDLMSVSYGPYLENYSGTVEDVLLMDFGENDHYLSVFDLKTGKRLWEISSKYNSSNNNHKTIYTDDLGEDPLLINVYSNYLDIVDIKDGKVLTHAEYPSVIVQAAVYNNAVRCITQDGGLSNIKAGDKDWVVIYSFVNNIGGVELGPDDFWIVQYNSESILHYGLIIPDPSWVKIKDDITDGKARADFYGNKSIFDGDSFVVESNSWTKFLYYDPEVKELKYSELSDTLDDDGFSYSFKPLRLSNGILSLVKTSYNSIAELWNVDLETGEKDVFSYSEGQDEFIAVLGDSSVQEWYGIIKVLTEDWDYQYYFASFDYGFNVNNKVLLKKGSYASVGEYWDKDGHVYIKFSDSDSAFEVDLKSFTAAECSGDLGDALSSIKYSEFKHRITYDKGSRMTAVNTGDRIAVFDKDRKLITTINGSADIISVSFAESGRYILALCRDNQIRRYDTKSGELFSRCDVDFDSSYIFPEDVRWTETDKGFMIMTFDKECAFLISEDDWDIFAKISRCTGYLPSDDFFVMIPSSLDFYESGGFKRHTTDSLVSYGKEILGGWELSEAQKMRYGME